MIQRNTDGTHTLKADAFATADCRFQLANLDGTAAGLRGATGATVADDPDHRSATRTSCCCASRTARSSTAPRTASTRRASTGRPSTTAPPAADRVSGGNDNDTFWGDAGNDVIEGSGGDDVALGGDGNDIVTDLAGADILEGWPGQRRPRRRYRPRHPPRRRRAGLHQRRRQRQPDASPARATTSSSPARARTPCSVTAATTGSRAAPARTCCTATTVRRSSTTRGRSQPGNDVFVGQVGENNYDAEGGDDIMASERGHRPLRRGRRVRLGDPPVRHRRRRRRHDHQQHPGRATAPVVVNRDRWQETEAVSGSPFDDVIRGDDDRARADRGRPASPAVTCSTRRGSTASPASRHLLPRSPRPLPGPVVAASTGGLLPARRARSGAPATSCSAVRAATPSKAAAATTSSTATGRCRCGSACAPTRPTPPPRSARPTSWSTPYQRDGDGPAHRP